MIRARLDVIWFYAKPASRECLGCIFDNERSKVCKQAGEAAVAAGMPDCESSGPGASSYIYRLDLSNGKQMDLLEDMKTERKDDMERTCLTHDDGPRGRSVAEIVEQRDAALARIRTMLAEKPVTVHDVCIALGVARGAAYRLLKHLAVEDEVHPTRKFDRKRREYWAAGPGEDRRKGAAVKITAVRAEQVGVQRDELVAALFGPAPTAA